MSSSAPERLGMDVTRRLERVWRASVVFVTTVGVFTPVAVFGQGLTQDLINYILLTLTKILELIIDFMGQLVLTFVSVVIDVAQYNSFVTATPVNVGWPLIRDVTNMFFIVILLITAFSTIVQWSKFKYREILPRLLMMAVLVNFSKTIIGVLIDASQVLMLTFVNGFKVAAGQNFMTALKLDKMMKLNIINYGGDISTAPAVDLQSPIVKVLLAEFLGLFFMGTTVIMLVIMIVYLVARVVGLWIALIVSPAAFFATALKSTPLASKVGLFGDKYWQRLGALLSGGPIMAFFLWLTLATVQQGGLTGFANQAAQGTQEQQAQSFFASAMGNIEDVATYFVAIMMMLMGIEAAVSIAGEVSQTLGGAAGKIRSGGMAATRFATYGGLLAAGAFGARVARKGVGAGARAAESRVDLQGRVGRGMQFLGAKTGITTLAAAGAGLRARAAIPRAAAAKKVEAATAGMSPEQRLQFLESAGRSGGYKGQEAKLKFSSEMITDEAAKVTQERLEKEAEARGMTPVDAATYAKKETLRRQSDSLAELEKIAKNRSDVDTLGKVKEQKLKRPDRIINEGDRAEILQKIADMDASEKAKTVASQAYSNPEVADVILKSIPRDANGNFIEDSEGFRKLIKPGGLRADYLRHRDRELRDAAQNAGAVLNEATFDAAATAAGTGGYIERVRQPNGERILVTRTAEQINTVMNAAGVAIPFVAGPGGGGAPGPVARGERLASARAHFEDLRGRGAPPAEVRQARVDLMRSGGSLTDAYQVDQNGTFVSEAERSNFEINMQGAVQSARTGDVSVLQNMDISVLHKNAGGRNEARSSFVSGVNVDDLAASYRDTAMQPEARKTVMDMARVVHTEGSRVEKMVANFNKQHPEDAVDIQQVRNAGSLSDSTAREAALKTALGDSGLDLAVQDAVAASKKIDVEADPALRNFKSKGSFRTTIAAKKAAGATARGASTATAAVAGVATAAAHRVSRKGRVEAGVRSAERKATRMEISGKPTREERRAEKVNRQAEEWLGQNPDNPSSGTPKPPTSGGDSNT